MVAMEKKRGVAVIAVVVMAGCALATLLSFLGRFWWGFDLFANFHLQYAAVLAAVAVCFAVIRQRMLLVGSLLLLVPHLVCLSYYYPWKGAVETDGEPLLEVIAFNVLTSNLRHDEVLGYLQKEDPDVLLLVEVNQGWLEALAPLERTHPHFRQLPRADNFGMALYSRFPIRAHDTVALSSELPCMATLIDWDGRLISVIGAHPLPPIGGIRAMLRDQYLKQLGELAKVAGEGGDVVLLGDLNTTPWSHGFRELLESGGLLDSARRRGFQSSWKRLNPVFSLPLDHILHSPGLECVERRIGPDLGSDHRPVGASFHCR